MELQDIILNIVGVILVLNIGLIIWFQAKIRDELHLTYKYEGLFPAIKLVLGTLTLISFAMLFSLAETAYRTLRQRKE